MNAARLISSGWCTLVLLILANNGLAQMPSVGIIPGQFNVSSGGAAEYTIPIQVAPGTAGTAPKLSITYNSNASTNILGAGWTLNGISAITRGPKSLYTDGTIDGVRFTDTDALYLDGVRLIEVSVAGTGNDKQTEYRKESDDLSRIVRYGATLTNARFLVQTKGGVTLHFDGSNESTVRADGTPILWVVSRIVDTPGNFMEFRYRQNQQGDYTVSSIRYTGHEVRDEDGHLISSRKPYASIDFDYDDIARPIDTYVAGRLIRRTFRLRGIASRVAPAPSDGPSANWPLVTRYEFEYKDRNTNNRFVLTQVRQFGDDGSELQPTQFTYSQPQTGWKEANFQLPIAVLAGDEKFGRGYRFAQLRSGSTTVDLLFAALVEGKLESFAFQNQGGTWVPNDIYKPPFAFVSGDGADLGAIVIDLNGDGRSDLLQSYQASGQAPINNACIATDDGWKPVAGYNLPFTVSVDGKSRGKYIFAPFSGTGRLDLLYDVNGVRGFLVNTGTQWQSDPTHVPPVALTDAARAIDVNCDGRLELVAPVGNSWQTYQYAAGGWSQMSVQFAPPLPGNLQNAAIAQLDLNADGHLDIIASSAQSSIRKALVASSAGWTEEASMSPTFDLVDQVGADVGAILIDVNGDKKLDVIANRVDSNGQIVRFAFSQSSTGWSDLGAAFFVPTLLERKQNIPEANALVGDIDGDGFKDIATPSGTRNRFGQVFAGKPSGFEEKPEFVPPIAFTRKDQQDWGVRFADLNADGLPDVIFRREITKDGTTTQVAGAYINTGNGWKTEAGFTPPQPIAADWITGNPIQLVDVDSDGFIDMLYSYRKADGTSLRGYYRNTAVADGSRKWTEQPNSSLLPPATYPFAIEKEGDQGVQLIDLNVDGRVDILTSRINAKNPQNPTPVENCTIVNGQQQCILNRALFSGTAFINDGTVWKETPAYASPLPFIAKPERTTDPTKHLYVQIIDIDGDRRPDLIARFKHPHNETKEVNEVWLNTGGGWRPSVIQAPVSLDEPLRNDRASSHWLDVNGDGLGDLLYAERKGSVNNSKTWLSTGNGFKLSNEWQIPTEVLADQARDQGFVFADIDGDGLSDIIYSRLTANGQHERGALVNNGTKWVSLNAAAVEKVPPFSNAEGHDQGVRLVDVDGNGLPDIIKAYNSSNGGVVERLSLLNTGRRSEVLQEVLPGYDAKTKITYQTLLEVLPSNGAGGHAGNIPWNQVYYPAPLISQYPVLTPVPTAYVVSQTSSELPGHASRHFYRYGDFRLHATALHPLGYGWREVYDETSGIVTRSEYARNIETAGKPVREASCWVRFSANPNAPKVPDNLCPPGPVTLQWINKLNETTNSWRSIDFAPNVGSSTAKIQQTLLESTITETWELDKQLVARETTKLTYDAPPAYLDRTLNVLTTQVTRLDGTRVETVNEYGQENPARWLLGRLTKATVTKTGDPGRNSANNHKTERRVTTFTYDATTGLLKSSTIEPGNQKSVTTTYERDKYGNVEKTILSAIGMQARTSISIYDNLGRFIKEEINALNHKTIHERNEKTGLPIKITDPNNLPTTYTYDGFGRSSTETGPSGITRAVKRLNKVDIANEFTSGLHVAYVEQITVGSLPPALQLYDAWGRLVRTASQAFTLNDKLDRWVHVDQIYDLLGRIEKKSLPYVRGKQPIWNKMTYDALGRVTLIEQPDGNKTRTEFTGRPKGGRFIATCDAKGHRTLTELNTRALPVTVTDVQGGQVSYEYDAGDRLEVMKGPTGAVTLTKYDDLGQRVKVSDPDMGVWSYQYNPFGELTKQEHTNGQSITLGYDLLGRITSKSMSDGTIIEWEYDGADAGIGKLKKVRDATRYEQTFIYDSHGRPHRSVVTIRGSESSFSTTIEWDSLSRPHKTTYPAPNGSKPFIVENSYDRKGFLRRIQNEGGTRLYWQVLDIDEFGRVIKEDYGNGVETITKYNNNTGELENTHAKKLGGATILDLNLKYDALGSLLLRQENVQNIVETFTYDPLDRLKSTTRAGQPTKLYEYDAAGRFQKKAGVEYTYQSNAPAGAWQPYHAVLKIQKGAEVKKYNYEVNGNLKSGNGRTISYTTDNLVQKVSKDDTHWIEFDYSPLGERYRQVERDGQREIETIYVGAFEQVQEFDVDDRAQPKSKQFSYYLSNGEGVFAIVEQTFDTKAVINVWSSTSGLPSAVETNSTWYLHKDQLGSVLRVTDEAGALAVRYWYDPWGQQMGVTSLPAGEKFRALRRQGFTSHEQLTTMGLIHMNGRVYDFETGMFISADPVDLVTGYTQTIGRYAYALNNPLKYTDPTGYWSWKRALRGAVVGFFTGGPGGAIAGAGIAGNDKTYKFIKENWREIAVVSVAVVVTIGTAGVGAGISGAILTGMAAGAASGATKAALYGGDIGDIFGEAVKGGVIGGISGAAFYGVGTAFNGEVGSIGNSNSFESIAAHGVVGGGVSGLEGGSFWTGFASGAITKASSIYGPQTSNLGVNVVRAAVVGGTMAEISGGKFANGAIIGAYSYTLNDFLHSGIKQREKEARATHADDAIEPSYLIEDAIGLLTGANALRRGVVTAVEGGMSLWPAASRGRTVINGIEYTTHALERMQPVGTIMKGAGSFSRGVPPSVVENAIKYGKITSGNTAGEVIRTFENVRVITNSQGTRVISVIKTGH